MSSAESNPAIFKLRRLSREDSRLKNEPGLLPVVRRVFSSEFRLSGGPPKGGTPNSKRMDGMKTNTTNLLRILFGVALGIVLTAGVTNAQPSSAPNSNSAQVTDAKDANKTAKTEVKKTTAKKPEKVPTSESVGEDAGNYTVMSTLEFG